jgi:hypothetical protein
VESTTDGLETLLNLFSFLNQQGSNEHLWSVRHSSKYGEHSNEENHACDLLILQTHWTLNQDTSEVA